MSQGITLASSQAVSNARKLEWPLREVAEGVFETEAPGGYKFYLQNSSPPQSGNYTNKSPLSKGISDGRREGTGFLPPVESFYTGVTCLSQAGIICSWRDFLLIRTL